MMRLNDDLWTVYSQARTNAPAAASPVGVRDLATSRTCISRATCPTAWRPRCAESRLVGPRRDHPARTAPMPSLATAPGPYARQSHGTNSAWAATPTGWNLHFYGLGARILPGSSRAHRQVLGPGLGWPDLPLWVTEFGFAASFPPQAPPMKCCSHDNARSSERVAAEGAALGTARQWAFMLPSFVEAGL
jgi:hypothetical protein